MRQPRPRALVETILVVLPGLVAVAGLSALPVLTVARNRLLPGAPVQPEGVGAPGIAALTVLAVLLAVSRRGSSIARWAAIAAACAALLLLAHTAGAGAERALADLPPAARASLGSGAWVSGFGLVLLLTRLSGRARHGAAAPALLIGALCAAYLLGWFDRLSLAVEYRGRAEAVNRAILAHMSLSGAALALAMVVAIPLAALVFRRGRAGEIVEGVLRGVQVMPALALFGLLVPLLSGLLGQFPALRGLGLAATGPTPAILGVGAYLLLPLVRSLVDGLRTADDAVLESARALGMTDAGILRRVRVPLGAPLIVGGFRTAAVQAIGFMVLGGLVGAGGLGAVVFEGMSQFAADLILLGALPVVALSVAVDGAFRAVAGFPMVARATA